MNEQMKAGQYESYQGEQRAQCDETEGRYRSVRLKNYDFVVAQLFIDLAVKVV